MIDVEENSFSDEEIAEFVAQVSGEREALAHLKEQVMYATDGVKLLNLWGFADGIRRRTNDAAVVELADEVTAEILDNESCLPGLVEWAEQSGRFPSLNYRSKYREALKSIYDRRHYTDDDEPLWDEEFVSAIEELVGDVKGSKSYLFLGAAWSFIHDEYPGNTYGPLTEAFVQNPETPDSVREAAKAELDTLTPTDD